MLLHLPLGPTTITININKNILRYQIEDKTLQQQQHTKSLNKKVEKTSVVFTTAATVTATAYAAS